MKLSVVIVSYNVKHFLFQCLQSVIKATEHIDSEIWVVDNASKDHSVPFIKTHFPSVKVIANEKNVGFSKANNQAIQSATGQYILLLNPDTLVAEDTFQKTISFMDEKPKVGAVGVKMIDGAGNFLPESKRGLPTPIAALSKMTGLNKIFPKSEVFGQYHLKFLDENQNHKINVLCGAYMCIPKSVLDVVGLLDETFFMYGEDIDLSYRIEKGGYDNYYLSDTTIIHYKGESTKKLTANYVKIFYNAMLIFAKKHQTGGTKWFFSFLIKLAIYVRASLAMLINFITLQGIKIVEALIIYFSLFGLTKYWEKHIKYIDSYPNEMFTIHLPYYTLVWSLSLIVFGSYQKFHSYNRLIKSIIAGLFLVLIIYGLFPSELRFSRGIILFGTLIITTALVLFRFFIGLRKKQHGEGLQGNTLIIGSDSSFRFIKKLLSAVNPKLPIIGFVSKNKEKHPYFLGLLGNVQDIIKNYRTEEVVLDLNQVSNKEAINFIIQNKNKFLFYTQPLQSDFLIASQSRNSNGVLISKSNNFQIEQPALIREKRRNDLLISGLVLIAAPILIFFKRGRAILSNIDSIFIGNKTWVGYSLESSEDLPESKPPVIDISQSDFHKKRIYAEYYSASLDRLYLIRYLLGRD